MIIIRKATERDIMDIAKVDVQTRLDALIGIVPNSVTENLKIDFQAEHLRKKIFQDQNVNAYVAENQLGDIIGYASIKYTRNAEYDVELKAMYILPEYQKQGAGNTFFKHIAKDMLENNTKSMILWVFEALKSCNFYDYVGGKQVGSKVVVISDESLNQVAYAFEDVSIFL